MTRIVLHSPLDPVAAALRLKAAVGDGAKPDDARCVTGQGSDQAMTLWVHRPNIRNDFKTVLTATLTPERGGTRIEGRIGRARGVNVFLALWCGFVGLFLAFGLFAMTLGGDASGAGAMFVLIPFGMLAMVVLMTVLSSRLTRGDGPMMLDFLERTIDARAVGARTAGTRDAGVSR